MDIIKLLQLLGLLMTIAALTTVIQFVHIIQHLQFLRHVFAYSKRQWLYVLLTEGPMDGGMILRTNFTLAKYS